MSAPADDARSLLAAGQPAAALKALQQAVRGSAADAKLRVFLFQLQAVLGQWTKAADQLKVCGELDASTLAMVNTYSVALACETARDAVFAGKVAPHVFGAPTPWVAQLAQALQLDAQGHGSEAAALRRQALDAAPAGSGRLDGEPFEWIADADSRLGPVLEIIISGRYGWLPLAHVARLEIEAVTDLRDLVWAPVQLTFVNGGQTVALVPARYDGSAAADDPALQMARRTDWIELTGSAAAGDAHYRGLGQRVLVTDRGEKGLLEIRSLEFDPVAEAENAAGAETD
jgi:type VI secretion system protein ImpE